MQDINMLGVVMRMLHITGAIVAAGGSIFALFALLPAASTLSKEDRTRLDENIRRRFGKLFMVAIGALVVSGLYNYIVNEMPAHSGQAIYHALMGVKIILALIVFVLGSALMGRAKVFEGIRARRKRWLGRNVSLVLVIVAIAAVLHAIP
ncbi:MAG: CopD family protein [Phycisphaerae bacterium]